MLRPFSPSENKHSPFILAIGLNPSYQKTLTFDKLKFGDVNRAVSQRVSMGGKAQHFVRAANTLVPGSTSIAHFVGGDTGMFIKEAVNRFSGSDDVHIHVEVEAPTRTCTTLLTKEGDMTELIEPSVAIQPKYMQQLSERVEEVLSSGSLRALAFCGTAPPGVPADFFVNLALNRPKDCLLFLDCYQNIQAILETRKVDILKINASELQSLFPDQSSVHERASFCISQYGVKAVAITDGPKAAYLFQDDNTAYQYALPKVHVENPIGAGDTVGAVTLVSFLRKMDLPDAFRLGLAAASASCQHFEGAEFSLGEMEAVNPQVQRSEMSKL